MKKIIALLLTVIMLFTFITPAVGAVAASDNAAVSTVNEKTARDSEESGGFFASIKNAFHNLVSKFFALFNAKCPMCGEKHDSVSSDDSHAHNYETREINRKEPTCAENGSFVRVTSCTVCGDTINSEVVIVPATGNHNYVTPDESTRVVADCVTGGFLEMLCGCGDRQIVTTDVDKNNHRTVTVLEAKAPTCTATGLTEGKRCDACDVVILAQEIIPATGHDYSSEVTKVPDCTETGVETFTCANCGDSYTKAISATGHTAGEAVIENNVAAGCENDGSYDTVVYCTVCNTQLSRVTDKVPATGHAYNAVVTAPTCETQGYTTHTCTKCDDTYEDTYVDATGHSLGDWIIDADATCITAGSKHKDCASCDYTVTEEIPATGHSYETAVTAPECEFKGYTTYTCHCGDTYKADYTDALGHNYKVTADVASTCTAEGYTTYTCDNDNKHAYTEYKNLLPHTSGEVVVENSVAATCTTDGSYDNATYCTACNAETGRETVIVKAPGHKEVVDAAVAATCTTDGKTEGKHCSTCNTVLVAQNVVPAKGHTEVVDKAVDATCTATGLTEGKHCSTCNTVLVAQETVAVLGHKEVVDKAVAATCTTDGKTEGKHCSVCDVVLTAQTTVPATGHAYSSEITTAPTCTEKGVKTFTCANDAAHTYTESVDALGHKDEDNNGWCDVCEKLICTHEGQETYVVNNKEATCEANGYTGDTKCKKCNETIAEGEVIAASGHTPAEAVEENRIESTCTVAGSYDSVVKCSVCTTELSRETVALELAAHTEETIPAVAATCTATGLTEGKHCSVCNAVLVAQDTVEKLAHTPAEAVVENRTESTCTVAGSYDSVVKCSACTAELSRETVDLPLAAHTEAAAVEENRVESTCTVAGSYDSVVKCSVCDAELSRETIALELAAHTEESIPAVDATCTATGKTEGKKCSVCNEVLKAQENVNALGHDYSVEVSSTAGDCKTNATTTYKCSRCESTNVVTGDLGSHKYDSVVTDPTCTTDGYTTYTCSLCEDSYEAGNVNALGHDYSVEVSSTAGDCKTNATTTYKCSRCESTNVVTGDLGSHKYDSVVTDPTCTTDGYTTYTCSLCEDSYEAGNVNALGHDYSVEVSSTAGDCKTNATTTYKCSRCESTNVVTGALGNHSYDENGKCTVCQAVIVTFSKKFDKDFLYRVGNQNAVALGSLFSTNVAEVDSSKISVSIVAVDDTDASGEYTSNADWTKGTIKFDGTGVVKVTISYENCDACDLYLEVVDAVNATSATSAKTNNVVLLNDCGFSALYVENGYTLYGNGFTMTTSDIAYDTLGEAYVYLKNGTLDNVHIICPNYMYAFLYFNQIKDSYKASDSGDQCYNVRNGVIAEDNSKILNSYISGARAAVYQQNGTLLIDNSTIVGGSIANILTGTTNGLILRDVTLIQKPILGSCKTKDPETTGSNEVIGFSVLVQCDENGEGTPVTLEGELKQFAWANTSYSSYAPDGDTTVKKAISSIFTNISGKKECIHNTDIGGVTENWFNLGIAFANMDGKSVSSANIIDNRINKTEVPYSDISVSADVIRARVYTYVNANGTIAELKEEPSYESSSYSGILPSISYNDSRDGVTMTVKYDDKGWNSIVTLDLDKTGDYNFSLKDLIAQKYGENLSFVVKDSNGNEVATDTITFDNPATSEYILVVEDDLFYSPDGVKLDKTISYEIPLTINATRTAIAAPEKISGASGDALMVVKAKNSDWNIAVPALDGVQIKYWKNSVKAYETLSLSSITPTTTGKQNGTNNLWEYKDSNNDFTLKITTSVMQDSKGVYGMPVVVNNSGNKLYFTISSTNGYVSTSTAARSVTLTYEFETSNGTLKFTESWSITRANYTGTQYSYSDFANGSLKEASGGCFTPETLITLADGSQVQAQHLKGDEMLLVWNHETGSFDTARIAFLQKHGDVVETQEIIRLCFSDGSDVEVINDHVFYDATLNKYVVIGNNADEFIGHSFVSLAGDNSLEKVELVGVEFETKETRAYEVITDKQLTCFTNGVLSASVCLDNILNAYDIDAETLSYDSAKRQADIEKYGLYTYADFEGLLPEVAFDMLNLKNIKVSVGKGYLTWDDILGLIEIYHNDELVPNV